MATNKNTIDLKSTNLNGGGVVSPAVSIITNNSQNSPVSSNSVGTITYPFVSPYGTSNSGIAVYPNDTTQLNVFNAVEQYLETDFRIATYKKDGDTITLDVEKDLSNLGYISGRYRAEYQFYRNYLGSGDAHKLQIQEISADGLEIRVIHAVSSVYGNVNYTNYFSDGFFKVPKSQVLPNLFLHKDPTTSMRVFDYVQDKFTFPNPPYSIIFKLNTAAPKSVSIGDFLWLAQQVSEPISDFITIIPPKRKSTKVKIAGPNWDAINKESTSVSTQYKDWDDLLTTNTSTSQQILNKLLSSSFIEGIPLNIDYRSFNNFITFGSATERLHNFKYKMQLLENYDAKIVQLTTGLTGLSNSSSTGSAYYQSNVIDAQTKRAALLGTFDGYENYLYNQSSSYESSSYGEFTPTTWPKSTSAVPHINYSYSSSQAEDWFDGIVSSASLFDITNDNALYKLIPAHIIQDTANEEYILFTQMIGHYFDLQFAYVKQMTAVTNRDESLLEGFSKELVYHVAKNLGVDFENGNSLEELWNYSLGTDATGSLTSVYGTTIEDKTKETWKRIINNLPYLLKTKGTERGVRALINCFGIPQTILRIREYGGAEPEFDSKTDLVYERFNYATNVGYNGTTGSYVANLIQIPWQKLTENNSLPYTVELRAAMASNETKDQTVFEVPDKWKVRAFRSAGSDYIGFFLSGSQGWATASVSTSFYDGNYHHIALTRDTAANPTFTLTLKKTNYNKVVSTQTASLYINTATSASYVTSYETTGNLWIPGSGSYTAAQSSSMEILTGSVQELRYWTAPLENLVLDNHALAPTSFQGNTDGVYTGSTSSFESLGFRLCLGSDNKKTNLNTTSSLVSQHPNQENIYFSGSLYKSGSFFNFPLASDYYKPITEIHSLEWPDLGGNRSVSNKIRVDNTIRVGERLYRDNKVERALSDNYPIDGPRLGIFFSPTNEVNQDIAEQFGGLSMDDYIGDPSHITLDTYPDLDRLKHEYNKKYSARIGQQNYIRLMKHYDASLFKLIKKFVPYRANTQVGLVIEPDILHRNKVPSKAPSTEELHYSASITIPEVWVVPGGFVQDGDGEPFRNTDGYVPVGVIGGDESDYVLVAGTEQYLHEAPPADSGILVNENLLPSIEYNMVVDNQNEKLLVLTLSGNTNEFNNTGVSNQPSAEDSLMCEIDLGVSSYGRDTRVLGSQYVFMTYATSGSYLPLYYYGTGSYGSSSYATGSLVTSLPYLITSSRYDYHEALPPVIQTSRRSEIYNVTRDIYDIDIYGSKAFTHTASYGTEAPSNTIYSSSAALYTNRWTQDFGLRIDPSYDDNATQFVDYSSDYYWSLSGSNGLQFTHATVTSNLVTGYAKIPAFFYQADNTATHNLSYRVEVSYSASYDPLDSYPTLNIYCGDSLTNLGATIAATSTGTVTFTTQATGPWLAFQAITSCDLAPVSLSILTLSVECLNYRAEVQDFHLKDSHGMRNARYDGCKMTSADYNIDSSDTSDGGPVITVTVGGGKQLIQKPGTRGNLEIN